VKADAIKVKTKNGASPKEADASMGAKVKSEIIAWFWVILAFMLINGTLGQARVIPSGSMENTLLIGDHLIMSRVGYDAGIPFTNIHVPLWREPKRLQIVIFKPPFDPAHPDYVKRVIGLPGETVDVHEGAVWISADRGVVRIDGATFAARLFGRGDGVASAPHIERSGVKLTDDELLFGGSRGITLIHPRRTTLPQAPPPVVATRITVGPQEVPSARFNGAASGAGLDVAAGTPSISVEFAALDFADPAQNVYEYRLEGYDRDWIRAGADGRVAKYTNLSPGSYDLRVRGTDHGGNWSPHELQLPIRVAAAWYQTWWFHALEAGGAALAFFLALQVRTSFLRAKRRELEAIVRERTQALLEATTARHALIENLAHDLRTPLTSLRGYLERLSLKGAALAEADRHQYVGIAVRQADRLNRLVRELFDLMRLDDAGARLKLERFSPLELVQDVVQEFASVAEERILAVEAAPGAETAQIVGDINLIQRMIDNLVDNALRHTPDGGKITIRLGIEGDQLVLDVSDTGRGIERADLGRIFNRYERGDTAGRSPGTGLGLAIVKRIVELHAGTITAASQVGVGTQFTGRLPLAGPAAVAAADADR